MIDINEYLPEFLQEYEELKAINNCNNRYFNDLLDDMTHFLMELSLNECDEDGLRRFEQLVGSYPYEDDTIESRKMRVSRKLKLKGKYNFYNLKKYIEEIQGDDDFTVKLEKLNQFIFKITIKTKIDTKWQFNDIMETMYEMLPCNVAIQYDNSIRVTTDDTYWYRFLYVNEYESLSMEVDCRE